MPISPGFNTDMQRDKQPGARGGTQRNPGLYLLFEPGVKSGWWWADLIAGLALVFFITVRD